MKHAQRYVSLDVNVIAVAITRVEGTWSAYIGAVAGLLHDDEWRSVRDHGSKLDENIARAIFDISPFNNLPYSQYW